MRTTLARCALLSLLSLGAQACCCIPIPRTVPTQPLAQITVLDLNTSAPIASAQVTVTRIEETPHYGQVLGEWQRQSDAQGVARFSAESEREWVMPLMIHGVGSRMWRVCVSHPGYVTEFRRLAAEQELADQRPAPPMTLYMRPGEGSPCPSRSSEPQLRPGAPQSPVGGGKLIDVRHDASP